MFCDDCALELIPSDRLLGGVRRLPMLPVAGDCELLVDEKVGNFWRLESGGGGSSKLGRDEALGRRAVKLVGAPIESGPGCIWVGRATAAATLKDFAGPWPAGRSLEVRGGEGSEYRVLVGGGVLTPAPGQD